MYMFLDGVLDWAVQTNTQQWNYNQKTVSIGAHEDGTNGFRGWIDEVRISKGIARWTSTFDDVLPAFNATRLIAPAYFVVAGANPGEGAVVTRNRTHAVDTHGGTAQGIWRLTAPKEWWRLETNYACPDFAERFSRWNAAHISQLRA